MNQALTLRPDTAFTDIKGERKDKLEREQNKRFAACRSLLAAVAEPGEEVLYIAQAVAPFSTLEFLTTGWILMSLKRCFLVLADRRLLQVPLTVRGNAKRSIAELRYADLKAIKVQGVFAGVVDVVGASGKRERFTQVRSPEKKKLQALLQNRANPAPAPSNGPARRFLCPRCAKRWAGEESCAQCGLAFKNRRLGFWLALLAPGGGYFYTGHPWLGIGDALTEIFLLVLLLVGVISLATGDQDALPVLAIAGIGLFFEKLISIYHVRHYLAEALPADSSFSPGI